MTWVIFIVSLDKLHGIFAAVDVAALREGQHMANHIVIRNELRARGFMALPDQMMVLKIPPDARIRQLDIRIIVKQMFRHSMLPTRLSTAMMWSFTVVYQQPSWKWLHIETRVFRTRCSIEHWPELTILY